MILEVPLVLQERNTVDCGLACLSMLLRYYNIEKTIGELKKDIKVCENIGVSALQLGTYLLGQRFEVALVTMNPHLFTKKSIEKSQEELLWHFKNLHERTKKENLKEDLEFFIGFSGRGGKVITKVPTVEDIVDEISYGRPLCVSLTSNFLLSDKAHFNSHFNIVRGIDEKFVYVNDPFPDYRGGNQKYLINDFMYAVYASAYGDVDNASFIKAKKI